MHCNTHSRSCSVEKFFFFFVPSRRTYFPRLPSIGRHSARFSRLRTREYLANFIHYHKSPTIFTRRKTSFASPCFFLFFFTFRLAYVHSRTPVGSSSQPAIKRRGWWRWWAPTTLRHYTYTIHPVPVGCSETWTTTTPRRRPYANWTRSSDERASYAEDRPTTSQHECWARFDGVWWDRSIPQTVCGEK